MQVAITGGAGFVGTALADWLLSRGHSVVAITRGRTPDPRTVMRVVADLDDREGLRRAFEGADVVVHLAARVHVMRDHAADPLAEFRHVNVDGTRNAHAAARDAGVRRFVLLSSIKAMGAGSGVPYRESDPAQPVDPYGVSKREAELTLAETSRADGIEYAILRPTLVYGAGVAGNLRRLLRLAELAGSVPLPLGRIANRRSLTSVMNLASAIEAVATHSAAANRAFLISDGEDLSTSDLIAHLADGIGRPARLLRCPVRLLQGFAAALGQRPAAERLFGSLVVDSSCIRRDLGWSAPQTATEALHQTGTWWRDFRTLRAAA